MKKLVSLVMAGALCLSVLTACGSNGEKPAQQQQQEQSGETKGEANEAESTKVKDTFIVATKREPKSLVPHGSNDTGTSFVTALIYDSLLSFDKDMNVIPCLATDWEKKDDVTYVFNLRDDVYFHNGEKLTAEDVKFTFEKAAKSPATIAQLGMIDPEKTNVVDENTIEIVLSKPFPPILNSLALEIASIVNKKAFEEGNFEESPIGTGPFTFKQWVSGDRLELNGNKEYWGEKAAINTLVLRLIPEATTRAIEIETGGVDMALGLSDSDTINLRENPNVNMYTENILNTSYMSFNCSKAPFDNAKVRAAITYAIDAKAVADAASFGLAEQSFSPIAPGVFGYYNPGQVYEYNPEKAKELLAEAGFPDGFKTTLTQSGDDAQAEMIQNMLGKVGISVEINSVDFANWLDALVNGKQEMYLGGWTVSTADADGGLNEPFNSKNHGDGGNRSFYTNTELDEILEAAAVELDTEKRLELYKEAQTIIANDAVYVNLMIGRTNVATKKEVTNLELMPTQNIKLNLIRFE